MAVGGREFVSDTDIFGSLKKILRICISTKDLTETAKTIVLTHDDNFDGKLQMSSH
jgi:hypothetical protein